MTNRRGNTDDMPEVAQDETLTVNYEELAICSSARRKGEKDGLYVYEFLKEPLIRALGEEMYKELCIAAVELRKRYRK